MEHNYQLELENRQQRAEQLTIELETINRKIAKLRLDKESKELELIAAIQHEHEGSKTYDIGLHSVTIKTDMIYSLDKKAYISGDVFLPPEFDPVLQKITYEVNKKLFNAYEQMAPLAVRKTLNELVTKKESKPNVSIKVRA
jgi:hypothetical protein